MIWSVFVLLPLRRIRQLHVGKQRAAKGIGELNYDVYQVRP